MQGSLAKQIEDDVKNMDEKLPDNALTHKLDDSIPEPEPFPTVEPQV